MKIASMAILLLSLQFSWVSFIAQASTHFSEAKWEFLSEDDGVRTYRWQAPGSPVFAMRGTGIIDAPPAVVASVLTDIDREKEWMPELEKSHVVKWISGIERIEYEHFGTPFVIKDRDFVLKGRAEYLAQENAIKFSFHSVEDAAVPPTDAVRGKIHASFYKIKPSEDGKKTHFEICLHVDPMGSVAKWIVNLFQKSFPQEFIESVREQVKKEDIQPLKPVADVFEGRSKSLIYDRS